MYLYQSPAPPLREAVEPRAQLTLYFADRNAQGVVAERREVKKSRSNPEGALEELIKGPAKDSELARTIPLGTRLLGVKLAGGVATVDFSEELSTGHWGGSAGETITVYSIVNTLTEFRQVRRVRILIDGEEVESLAGHIDLGAPLERNESVILRDSR